MTVIEFYKKLCEILPLSTACEWDNDGIMVSENLDAQVKKVLVALDATNDVIEYAASNGFDTVLTHHPMIYKRQKNVVSDTFCGQRIINAINNKLTVISLHTRLDSAKGGVNDTVLNLLGYEFSNVFGCEGAETIARYSDIQEISAESLAYLIKTKLSCETVRITGNLSKKIKRLGVCGGAGGDLVFPALNVGCDAFLTGDAGYNTAQDASEKGIVIFEIGHYHSEAPVCEVLMNYARDIAGAEVEFYNSCAYKII